MATYTAPFFFLLLLLSTTTSCQNTVTYNQFQGDFRLNLRVGYFKGRVDTTAQTNLAQQATYARVLTAKGLELVGFREVHPVLKQVLEAIRPELVTPETTVIGIGMEGSMKVGVSNFFVLSRGIAEQADLLHRFVHVDRHAQQHHIIFCFQR